MNKRQKKKVQKKEQLFMDFLVPSYRELKKMNRSYHEYRVWNNRHTKRCIGCVHSIGENGVHITCELVLSLEDCKYEQKGE